VGEFHSLGNMPVRIFGHKYPPSTAELLKTTKELLTEVQKQRLLLLPVEGAPMPCPACKSPH
jgi:hypothetical protein